MPSPSTVLVPALVRAPRGHGGVDTVAALATLRRGRGPAVAMAQMACARRKPDAAAWALELDPLLVTAGPFELHRDLLESALPLAPAESGLRSDILRALARMWAVRGMLSLSLRSIDDAIACAPADDALRVAAVRGLRGYVLTGLGRTEEAALDELAASRAAAQIDRRSERLRLAAFAAQTAGLGAGQRGDRATARAALEEMRDLARQAGADRLLALAHINLAEVTDSQPRAHAHLASARALFLALDDRLHVGRVDLALHRRGAGPLPPERLAQAAESLGDFEGATEAYLALFEDCLARGETEVARRHLHDAWRSLAQCDVVALSERCLEADARLGDRRPVLALDLRQPQLTFDGRRVDLRRRRALPGLLRALCTAVPGRALSVEELFAAGWPGERALASSAAARVYMAVRTLRQLGLARALETTAQGYRIATDVRVETSG